MKRLRDLTERLLSVYNLLFYVLVPVVYVFVRKAMLRGGVMTVYPDSTEYMAIPSRRSVSIPWFFHLLHNNTVWIWRSQFILSTLSWILLTFAIGLLVRRKLLAQAIILVFSLTYAFMQWDLTPLSESMSFDTLVLSIALAIALYIYVVRTRSIDWRLYAATIILWFPLLFLFANSRDSNMYALPIFILFAAVLLPKLRGKWPYVAVLTVGIAAMVAFQSHDAVVKRRPVLPVQDVIVHRVLMDPAFTQYFVDRGMPYSAKIQSLAGLWGVSPEVSENPDLKAWIKAEGQKVYQRYLISHFIPTNVTLLREIPAAFVRLSYPKFTPQSRLDSAPLDRAIFFRIGNPVPWFAALVLIPLILMWGFKYRRNLGLTALLTFVFMYSQAWVCYFGDAMEVERHSLMPNILFRVDLLLVLTYLLMFLGSKVRFGAPKTENDGGAAS